MENMVKNMVQGDKAQLVLQYGHSAVVGTRTIEEFIIPFLQVVISSNYIAGIRME